MACAPTTPTPGAGPIIEVIEDTFRVPAKITPFSSPLAPPGVRPFDSAQGKPSVGGTQAGIPAVSPTFAAGASHLLTTTPAPTVLPAASDGQTPFPLLSPTVSPVTPLGGTQAAATSNASGTLIRETAQFSATPSPSATQSPSATATTVPLAIRNDRGCLDTATDTVYIFGEVVNSSTQPYDVNDIDPTFFGPTGAILALRESFDMPGDFFVPPNGVMPFQITAELEGPGFTRYNNLTLLAEPGDHPPRDDLTIQITGTTPEDGDLLVEVRWTNPSLVSVYVAPFVVAHDAQGRVSNLAIDFLTGSDTFAGTHTIEMTLFANPCWSADDMLVPGIVGE